MSPEAFAAAVIVAAGEGRRLGGRRKAFLDLAGRSLVERAAERLAAAPEVSASVLVVHADDLNPARELLAARGRQLRLAAVVPGGPRRQDSVAAGLGALPECEVVLIHDGARPLVDPGVVSRVAREARVHGAAVAACPLSDTLKRAKATRVAETVDRSNLWAAQTPQGFRLEVYRELAARADAEGMEFTDDSAVFEHYGRPVELVASPAANLKITLPEDLALAEAILGSRSQARNPSPVRYGTGYDIHRLEAGRQLIIGGLRIDSPVGARAHSDGDALCHAVIDALLGAAALGDIGTHFPDTDERWRGARSLDLLADAGRKLKLAGWRAANVDATVFLERPKLGILKERMAANLAEALEIPAAAVSVKAGTNEGLGEIGRGEAVAAQAIASIQPL